ncbi:MAG: hypothetical protein U1A22_09735 [Xanthomonadaceae bacterium]|nr:hypothetical protein [Xanthomonadaceae bacterium]
MLIEQRKARLTGPEVGSLVQALRVRLFGAVSAGSVSERALIGDRGHQRFAPE